MSESDATPAPESTPASTAAASFDSIDQKVSYGIGMQMGSQLAQDPSLSIDLDALAEGIADALAGNQPKVSQADLMMAFQAKRAEAQEAANAKAQVNLEAGAAFLAQNGARPEVTTTASGLQYEVIVAGTGPKPTPAQSVQVHYHGTLIDGTVFDSSVQRGEPISFPVTGVIKGWIEALQLMPQGSKWKLYIPADLAYGNVDKGTIPPGSTLIFEVELLDIK
ncbi:FKBP-type peptidyl-prolyl cis-trans isomerase [Actomonas aquatica]|uniref:Peptidyl-prolyl cis-trans isomerase n=1 Tax=Actomonas aquatica TaxID=2866162 RepID=A0ABZ1C8R7_9BACT|nr:FKBP-type peptidyl-prolyl cis-trans isomerase [Opitutus sp. WL0086]WRQ87979.1 FKBP-type peptidyl-prolyl cis-trans isomerase [Opitutus sp. WL0086]